LDSLSNTKIIIQNSFSIEDSQKKSLYLLGFTVHSEGHYFSYLFDQSCDDFKLVKFDDLVGVEIIPNPWWEILTIDSDHELRPRIFIYGEVDSVYENYLTNLLVNIERYRSAHDDSLVESFAVASKRHKTTTNDLSSESHLKAPLKVCSIF